MYRKLALLLALGLGWGSLALQLVSLDDAPPYRPTSLGLCEEEPQFEKADHSVDGLLRKLQSKFERDRIDAVVRLGGHGPAAAKAIPALIEVLKNDSEEIRLNTAIALGEIGKAAIPELEKICEEKNEHVRYYAVWALGLIGPDAKDSLPVILKALDDKDDNVKRKAAYALGRIQPRSKEAVPALVKMLRTQNLDLQQQARESLAALGREAVPDMVKLLEWPINPNKPEFNQRHQEIQQALQVLAHMGPEAVEAAPAIRKLIEGADWHWGWQATQTMARIGKAAVPILNDVLKTGTNNARSHALQALSQMGADGVESLIDAVKHPEAHVRSTAVQMLSQSTVRDKRVVLAITSSINDDSANVRQQALWALQNIQAEPRDILPVASRLLKDKNKEVRWTAIQVMTRYGTDAVPHLVEALDDSDASIRQQAIQLFWGFAHANHPAAASAIRKGLGDSDQQVRQTALQIVQQHGDKFVPSFVEDLKSKEAKVRDQAVSALKTLAQARGQSKWTAKTSLPKLEESLQHEDVAIRLTVLRVLPLCGEDAIKPIQAALGDKEESVREEALAALADTQGRVHDRVTAIAKGLDDASARVRTAAASVLQRFDNEALPHLKKALSDSDDKVRQQVAVSLGNLRADATRVVPLLAEALRDRNAGVRASAAHSLDAFGGHAVEPLRNALLDPDYDVRWNAARSLGKIGEAAKAAIAVLIEVASKDAHESVRDAAVVALNKIGPDTIKVFLDVYKERETQLNRVLGRMGPESLAVLVDLVKDKDPLTRRLAVVHLGRLGPDSEPAVPQLVDVLADPDPQTRAAAVRALTQIGNKAGKAVERLKELRDNDPNEAVRKLADEAVRTILAKE